MTLASRQIDALKKKGNNPSWLLDHLSADNMHVWKGLSLSSALNPAVNIYPAY